MPILIAEEGEFADRSTVAVDMLTHTIEQIELATGLYGRYIAEGVVDAHGFPDRPLPWLEYIDVRGMSWEQANRASDGRGAACVPRDAIPYVASRVAEEIVKAKAEKPDKFRAPPERVIANLEALRLELGRRHLAEASP